MKRSLILIIGLIFIIGCGQPAEESKQKPVNSDKYIASGMKFLKEADIPRAIRSFDMAIKSDPTNTRNYIVLGQVYMQLKNYQGAVDVLTAATKVDAENGEAYYLLATSRALRGKEEDKIKALEAAKRSVEIYLKNRDEDRFKRAVVLLQNLSDRSDNTAQAVQDMDKTAEN